MRERPFRPEQIVEKNIKKIKVTCSICGREMEPSDVKLPIITANGTSHTCLRCSSIVHSSMSELINVFQFSEDQFRQNQKTGAHGKYDHLKTPVTIKGHLDEYVIGQEKAKKILSVAIYNHYKQLHLKDRSNIRFDKSNVLMIGPSGCGKTYLATIAATLLDVPFVSVDATSLTETGYHGEDAESILLKLIQSADGNIKRAETGIVYIDEIDKIAAVKGSSRDISGEGVQQALLKILGGSKIRIDTEKNKKSPRNEMIEIDTSNILFICGGAFEGIQAIIDERMKNKSSIGFGLKTNHLCEQSTIHSVTNKDLETYGLIREFIGRLPVTAVLDALTVDDLKRIITEPKNAILKQYQEMLSFDNLELTCSDEALEAIARKAIEEKTGARGLRAILEDLMLETMYLAPGIKDTSELMILASDVDGITNPSEHIVPKKKRRRRKVNQSDT